MLDVIVLAGGKGSRSANPSIPKTLQELSPGLTVLGSIAKATRKLPLGRVIPVLGHHRSEQFEAFNQINWGAPVIPVDSKDRGTSQAVVAASLECISDDVVVVMGDSALSAPLEDLYEYFLSLQVDALGLCRYSNHPADSDTLWLDTLGRVTDFSRKGSSPNHSRELGPRLSLSGILFAKREHLTRLEASGDFQESLFSLSKKDQLAFFGLVNRFFCRDTGTPERLKSAKEEFSSGSAGRRGKPWVGAVFIDRDGTLIPDTGDSRDSIKIEDLAEDIGFAIRDLNKSGFPVFIVSNQPGVAKGKLTIPEVLGTFSDLQRSLARCGAVFDDFRFCPHHPERGWAGEISSLKIQCKCRKPGTGMFLDLARAHSIDLTQSILIGDSEADRMAAQAAGLTFLPVSSNDSSSTSRALAKALGGMLLADQ